MPKHEEVQKLLDQLEKRTGVTRQHLFLALLKQTQSCRDCLIRIYREGAGAKCDKCRVAND